MTECQKPKLLSFAAWCLQFVKNDNNGIQSQTEVTYGESTYYKNATELDLHEIQQWSKEKWQRTVEINSELKKKKLNKHGTEQSEKLSDLKELPINAVLQKLLHWTQLNVKEIVTCTRCGFSVPSFSTKLPKKKKFTSSNELNCSCCCFDIDHSLKSPLL